jgi:hypothetical protein
VGLRAGLDVCGNSRLIDFLSPDRTALSEPLYRLSYPGLQYGRRIIHSFLAFEIYPQEPILLHFGIVLGDILALLRTTYVIYCPSSVTCLSGRSLPLFQGIRTVTGFSRHVK